MNGIESRRGITERHGGRQRHLVSARGVFCTCNSSCAVPLSLIGWETYSKSAPCHCTNRKYKWRRCSKSIWRERPLPLGNPPSDAQHMQTHGNHTSAQWPNPVHRVSIQDPRPLRAHLFISRYLTRLRAVEEPCIMTMLGHAWQEAMKFVFLRPPCNWKLSGIFDVKKQ